MFIKMEVDKIFAQIGEVLNYKITIHNTTGTTVEDIYLIDNLPIEIEQIEKSEEKIKIGTLLENEVKEVEFKCIIKQLPMVNPIVHIMDARFKNLSTGEIECVSSNTNLIVVNDPLMEPGNGIEFRIDKELMQKDSHLICEINLQNKGNVAVEDLKIENLYPKGMELEHDSLVGGATDSYHNGSWEIGRLEIGESKQLIYRIKIKDKIERYDFIHQISVAYSFSLQNRSKIRRQYKSNQIESKVCLATFDKEQGGFIKEVSQRECTLGDELSYTTKLTNKGNITAKQVYLKEELSEGIIFVPGSLRVAGEYYTTPSLPKEGILLGKIKPLQTVEVNYRVNVGKQLLSDNTICSKAKLEYEYQVGEKRLLNTEDSEEITTIVGAAIIDEENFEFYSKEEEVTIGDNIHYILNVRNKGNVVAEQVRINIKLPRGVKVITPEWRVEGDKAYLDYGIGLIPKKIYEFKITLNVEEGVDNEVIVIPCTIDYGYKVGGHQKRQNVRLQQMARTPIKVATILPGEGFVKQVDKQYAQVGEIVTYTIVIQNKGNIKATNIFLKEELQQDMQLEEQSLFIDDELLENQTLDEEIEIGELESECFKVLTYKVKIVDIPSEGKISTISHLSYEYKAQINRTKEIYYEGESIQICEARIGIRDGGIVKQSEPDYVTVGDKIKYTVILTNTGNVVASQVGIRPITQENKGVDVDDAFIEIGDILPKESKIISYDIQVDNLPEEGEIKGQEEVRYSIQVGEKLVEKHEKSEVTITPVEGAKLQSEYTPLVQQVDRTIVKVGDKISYQLKVENLGNILAENIHLILPSIQGVKWNDESIIKKEKLEPAKIEEYKYSLEVQELPSEGRIICAPYIEYEYKLTNGKVHFKRENIVPTTVEVKHAQLQGIEDELVAIPEPQYATTGETVLYKLEISNKGNIEANDIKICPQLKQGISLTSYTLLRDGRTKEGTETELEVGRLKAKEKIQLIYYIKLEKLLEEAKFSLPIEIEYNYDIMEEVVQKKLNIISEPLYIYLAEIEVDKQVDKKEITYGEQVKYEIVCKNTGNISAEEVLIKQQLPKGMGIVLESGVTNEEIKIECIKPGEEKKIVFHVEVNHNAQEGLIDKTHLGYKMQVNPNENKRVIETKPLSTTFDLKSPKITAKILEPIQTVIVGEIISYQLEIKNEGNVGVENLNIKPIIPEGIMIVPSSIKIDGRIYHLENKLIRYERLECNQKIQIEIEVKIDKRSKIYPAFLGTEILYEYRLREILIEEKGQSQMIPLKIEEIKLEVEKTSDKEEKRIRIGDEINYRVQITNVGTIGVAQILFFDKLPAGVSLMGSSIKIGDQIIAGTTLEEGMNLGEIQPNETILITYKVKVDAYYGKSITSEVYVEYMIRRNETSPFIKRQTPKQIHTLKVAVLEQTQLPYKNILTLPYQYPDVYEIINLEVQVTLIYMALLPDNNKVIQIRGQIHYKVWYRGMDKQIHTITWMMLVTEKVPLMMTIEENEIIIKADIEGYRVDIINGREIDVRTVVNIHEE